MKCERTGLKKFALLLFIGILCTVIAVPLTVLADETKTETVKIGYYPTANYQDVNEAGLRSGFSYDYYMQIQKYTRWEYEFVEASYAECMQMLIAGEIDIMSGISKTAAREEQMIFSRYSVSNAQNKLYAREEDQSLYYESYDSFNGCDVAIMQGSLHDELDTYCSDHGFSVNIKEYSTPSDMANALKAGMVDMICASSVSPEIATKIVAHMDKTPLYFAVNKNKPEIATELNNALRKITDNNPNFYTQMSEKYMINGASATATFTRDELDYIASGQAVYVIMNADWAPISWYDSESGNYRGIFVDVIEEMRKFSGLNFVMCTEDEFNNEIIAKDPEAENNVVAILADDNAWAVTQNVMMSNHVVDSSVVMVTKRSSHQTESPENLRIALPYRFYISWCMQGDFTEDQVIYYNTVEECLDAINQGKADATYINELVATYNLSKLEYSDLFATATSGYNENLAFAVNKASEKPLLSILDKSLLCIGDDEISQIVIMNSIAEQRVSFKGLYYSNPVLVIVLACLLILLIGGIAFAVYVTRTRRERLARELQKESETSAARTDFFMMISHELRTPLNAVSGYLDLASDQCQSGGSETEYLKRSRLAVKQLSRIAEDMLDYTRIASDTATLREESFDLKDSIRSLEQSISLEAEKKKQSFKFTVHDLEHEYVTGDRLRITQILQNLLSNSVKFTDEGGSVTADVYESQDEDGTMYLNFSAGDTGRGMSEEYLRKICAPFEQSDRAYSRTHGGLGLGLYLTKYYLDAMHGSLDVKSKLGEGSCFSVRIPLKAARSEEILNSGFELSQLRVMIGSSGNDGKQLKEALSRFGVKSDIQDTPEKLSRRVLSRSSGPYAYSLCIIDEEMLAGGYGTLGEIAAFDNAPRIYVLSGSTKNVKELESRSEINRVLYKPIFQSVLFNALLEDFGSASSEDSELSSADLSGIRCMVVEDNAINSDIITRMLNLAGAEVSIFENGKEAVDSFEAQPDAHDIILMDIQMPVMNGHEAARAIRNSAHSKGKTIPIVAVSANAFPEDVESSIASGMNEHLSKPVSAKLLYQVIEKYTNK